MTKNDSLTLFVRNKVALNPSRVDRINNGIQVVTDLLDGCEEYQGLIRSISPQGSFQLGTGIRPVQAGTDFDVDLLLELNPSTGSQPKDYLNRLHSFFYGMDRYRDIVDRRGKTRCVTLDYESDFHIDIVPCLDLGGQKFVSNKNTNQFEPTDGAGYTQWFNTYNLRTGQHLAEVVQLIKYLRDYKGNFKIKSIVLTTLLAQQIYISDTIASFPDLKTTLKLILQRLDSFLQASPLMPDVYNPALPSEKFTQRNWSQEQYANFRDKFHLYASQIIQATDTDDEKFDSTMQELFGNDFPSLSATSSTALRRKDDGCPSDSEQFIDEIVASAASSVFKIKIDAVFKAPGWSGRLLSQVRGALPSLGSLVFEAEVPSMYRNQRYRLYWKVKNRGEHAQSVNQLRGEITSDAGNYSKKEETKYTGEHYVECYLVDTVSNTLIGEGHADVPIA